jgi:hypothetical protein
LTTFFLFIVNKKKEMILSKLIESIYETTFDIYENIIHYVSDSFIYSYISGKNEPNYAYKKNFLLEYSNVNSEDVENLINKVKYEIKVDKEIKELEKRYELLLEDLKSEETYTSNDNNSSNNQGCVPMLA